jgi:hypothetical protein
LFRSKKALKNFIHDILVSNRLVVRAAPKDLQDIKIRHDSVQTDFFSPRGKHLSRCGKFNDNGAKHKQKSAILTVQKLVYDKLFILLWKIYHTVSDFYRTVRKISHRAGTCQ